MATGLAIRVETRWSYVPICCTHVSPTAAYAVETSDPTTAAALPSE